MKGVSPRGGVFGTRNCRAPALASVPSELASVSADRIGLIGPVDDEVVRGGGVACQILGDLLRDPWKRVERGRLVLEGDRGAGEGVIQAAREAGLDSGFTQILGEGVHPDGAVREAPLVVQGGVGQGPARGERHVAGVGQAVAKDHQVADETA
jgi:hypothetical protein